MQTGNAARELFEQAIRRRRRTLRRRRQQTPAATAGDAGGDPSPAPTLYGATTCAHQLAGMRREVESLGGGWFTLRIDPETVQLLTTRPFCDGRHCSVDHVDGGRRLLAWLRCVLARTPRYAAKVEIGGRWPWPNGLLPG